MGKLWILISGFGKIQTSTKKLKEIYILKSGIYYLNSLRIVKSLIINLI